MDSKQLVLTYFEAVKTGTWQDFTSARMIYVVADRANPLDEERFLQGVGQF